ncbi:MAG TPA: trypsin-like serine protease [Polyangiaceae bacterium]|nr:trypsin-like serine protease [Polyangiaceae bacterium]
MDRVAALREPVVDGERSPAGGVEDAVLLLRTELDGDELICSASLVAPNLVATARHCVSYLGRGIFSCTAQGELVSVDSGAGELGTHLEAAKLEFFSGTTPRTEPIAYGEEVLSTLSETICTNDIAFVVLDRAVDLPVLPLRLEGKAKRGELVTLVGYGLDNAMSQTNKLDYETQPRTQNDELVIADVGPLQSGQVSTIPPRSLLVEGPAGCLGDSGGPLLARETGAVLGVYSLLGGESCLQADARHLFTHVPLFPLLTEQAFEAAGAEPTPEPVTEPSGEGGGAGEGPGASGGTTATGAGGSAGDAGEATLGSEGGAGAAEPGAAGEPATGGTTAASGGATGTSGGAGVGDTPPKEPAHTPRDNGCTIAASPGHEVPRGALLVTLATYLASGVRRFRRR